MGRVAERRARRAWGECPKGRWLDAALEVIGMAVAVALFGGLLWLYLMATPDQASAEADLAECNSAISTAKERIDDAAVAWGSLRRGKQ